MNIVKIEKLGYEKIVDSLSLGNIIVYPTDTAYALGCDATNKEACEKILKIKNRNKHMTLPLIASDADMVESWFELSGKSKELADEHWPGALALIIPAKKDRLTELVKQDDMSAVRVPNNIIARTISRQLGKPIVATSANMSGKDTCYNIESVTSSLEDNLNEIEYIIDFGELNKGELSTIIKISDNEVETVREGIIKIK